MSCTPLFPSIYLSVHLPIHLFVHLSNCLSVPLYVSSPMLPYGETDGRDMTGCAMRISKCIGPLKPMPCHSPLKPLSLRA